MLTRQPFPHYSEIISVFQFWKSRKGGEVLGQWTQPYVFFQTPESHFLSDQKACDLLLSPNLEESSPTPFLFDIWFAKAEHVIKLPKSVTADPDLRSPCKWNSQRLSSENQNPIFVEHGFLWLTSVLVSYYPKQVYNCLVSMPRVIWDENWPHGNACVDFCDAGRVGGQNFSSDFGLEDEYDREIPDLPVSKQRHINNCVQSFLQWRSFIWGPARHGDRQQREGLGQDGIWSTLETATKAPRRRRPDAKICLFIQAEAHICHWREEEHEYESCNLGLACPHSEFFVASWTVNLLGVFNKWGYLTPCPALPGEPLSEDSQLWTVQVTSCNTWSWDSLNCIPQMPPSLK